MGLVAELEPMPLEVLGPPDHAVDVVVVSAAGVFVVDRDVADSCTVHADSPWEELKKSYYGLIDEKYRFKCKNS